MTHSRRASLQGAVLALCVLFVSFAAKADIQSIRNSDNEVWGAAGASFLNYKESVTPIPDSEHGTMPSLAAGVSYLGKSNLYLDLDGSVAFGNTHYNGALYDYKTGVYDIPTQATTNDTIANIGGKIGYGIPLASSFMLIPYADLGYRYWDRNLGYDEDYQNFDILAGLMGQFSPVKRLVLSAYGAAGTTFAAQMKTDGTTFDLGSTGVYKVGAKVGFDVTRRVELFTTLDYDHFHFGQSPLVYDSNSGYYALEPGSATSDTTWRVGVGYLFN